MAGSRPRPSRPRPPRRQQASQPPDVVTAARDVVDTLTSGTRPAPPYETLCQALTNFLRAPNVTSQLHVAHHLPCLLQQPLYPNLRLRVARLAEALTHWLAVDVDHALATLATLLNLLLSADTYEIPAIIATLHAISSAGSNASPSAATEDIVARHAPTLIPLLHATLFTLRQPTSDFLAPTSHSSATSDSTLNPSRTHVSTPRAPCVRHTAITTLHTIICAAPLATLPLWSQLLPTRPGVTATAAPPRRTLATILLFDPDASLRSAATALVSALVTAARPLLARPSRRHVATRPPPDVAFMPASQRVAATIIALHPAIVTALRGERAPTVIPRLARLASDLVVTACPPVVPAGEQVALLQALAHTALRQTPPTDLTSRAAAASALATALTAAGATHLGSTSLLDDISSRIVDVIGSTGEQRQHQQQSDTFPVAELLTVLRSIVTIDATMFPPLWMQLSTFCTDVVTSTAESDRDIALHTVRLVEAFATAYALGAKTSHDAIDEVEEDSSVANATAAVACDVYRRFLRRGLRHTFRAIQMATIVSMDALLQALPVGARTDTVGTDEPTESSEDLVMTVPARETMLEIVEVLMGIAIDESMWTGVRAAAVKAVGSFRVESVDDPLISRVVTMLRDIVRDSTGGNYAAIRARGLASFASVTGRMEQHGLSSWSLVSDGDSGTAGAAASMAGLCLEILGNEGRRQRDDGLSASVRANVESSRVGAVNSVTSFICMAISLDFETRDFGRVGTLVDDALILLVDMISDSNQSVIVRCACCKAIGRIVLTPIREERLVTVTKRRSLSDALSATIGQEAVARVQAVTAKSLSDIVAASATLMTNKATLLQRCGLSLLWCGRQLRSLEISSPSRGQYVHLQGCVSELTCKLLLVADDVHCLEVMDEEDGADEAIGRVMVDAVCRHYDMPKYLAEGFENVSSDYDGAVDTVLSTNEVPGVLSSEVEQALRKVFRWRSVAIGEKDGVVDANGHCISE